MSADPLQQVAPISRTQPRRYRINVEQTVLCLLVGAGAVLMVMPFYWMIVTAFKPKAEVLVFPPTWWPHDPTLQPWQELTELRGGFHIFFRNSIFVSVVTTALILLTSAATGYVFAKFNFRGRSVLFVVILSMMMIPFNVSLIPLYKLMADLRWTNTYWALIIPSAYSPVRHLFDAPVHALDPG